MSENAHRRVFLCDDDPDYRALVRAVLEPAGMEIVGEASNGIECAERLADSGAQVLLLDQKMPGANGLDALPAIRAAAPDVDVVFLTTSWRETLEERMLASGARAFVPKPRRIADLPGALSAALV